MTLLNQEIIKTQWHKCDNYDKNDLEIIKAKAKYDFILKHDDISDEFMIDYDMLHEEMNYAWWFHEYFIGTNHHDNNLWWFVVIKMICVCNNK